MEKDNYQAVKEVFAFKKGSINTEYMAGNNLEPFYKKAEFSFF